MLEQSYCNTTNYFFNSSNSSDIGSRVYESIVPPIIQFSFGVIGNIIAITFLIRSSKRHKWKPFYRFVGGLAINDLCGILFHYPVSLIRYISDFTFEFPPPLCSYLSFNFSFAFMSSAFMVCAMSCDRYVAILYPLRYYTRAKGRRVNTIIISIWLTTGCICSLNLVGLGTAKVYYPGSWCFLNFASRNTKDRINTYIYSITGLIILLTTFFVNAIVIFHLFRKFGGDNVHSSNKKKNDVATIIILMVIVSVFGICWAPLMIRMVVNASIQNPKNGPAELLAVRLTISNGIIDPWIYILLRKENILAFYKIFPSLRKRLSFGTIEESQSYVVADHVEPGTGSSGNTSISYIHIPHVSEITHL